MNFMNVLKAFGQNAAYALNEGSQRFLFGTLATLARGGGPDAQVRPQA